MSWSFNKVIKMNSVLRTNVAAIYGVIKAVTDGEKAIEAAERAVINSRSEVKYIARMKLAVVEKRAIKRVAAAEANSRRVLALSR
jgi:hypothetical protein